MKLDEMTAIKCHMALQEVLLSAQAAVDAENLEDAIAELDNVWSDVRKAREVLREAEAETRRRALAKVEPGHDL